MGRYPAPLLSLPMDLARFPLTILEYVGDAICQSQLQQVSHFCVTILDTSLSKRKRNGPHGARFVLPVRRSLPTFTPFYVGKQRRNPLLSPCLFLLLRQSLSSSPSSRCHFWPTTPRMCLPLIYCVRDSRPVRGLSLTPTAGECSSYHEILI